MNFLPIVVMHTFTIFFIINFIFGFIFGKSLYSNKLILILILILILNSIIYLFSSAFVYSFLDVPNLSGEHIRSILPLFPFFLFYGIFYSVTGSYLINFFTKKSFIDVFVFVPAFSMCLIILLLYVLQNLS